MNIEEDEVPEKSQIQHEHLERVKERMTVEEEALKASRVVKGADTKNYKKFKDGQYIPQPKQEMTDEMKLVLMREYQAFTGSMGFIGLGIAFFVIYNSTLRLSVFDSYLIVLKIYNSTLRLSVFNNYFGVEMNLILFGCAVAFASIVAIIYFQYKHDKISDRIHSEQ